MYRIVKAGVSCTGVGGWSAIYSSVDDALAAAQDDDTILITSGVYGAPANGWAIGKRLTIMGESPGIGGPSQTGTVLSPANTGDGNVFSITTASQTVKGCVVFRNLQVRPTSPVGAARSGPIFKLAANSGVIEYVLFDRIILNGCESDGFSCYGADGGPNAIVFLTFKQCVATGCKGIGFDLKNTTTTLLENCSAGGNLKYGYRFDSCSGIRMINCNNEANWNNNANTPDVDVEAGIRMLACSGFLVLAPHNEIGTNSNRTTFVSLQNCFSGSLEGGVYVNAADVTDSRGILIQGACRCIRVGPAEWVKVQKLVELQTPQTGSPPFGCLIEPQSMPNAGTNDGKIIFPVDTDLGNFGLLPASNTSPRSLGLRLPNWSDSGLATHFVSADAKLGTMLYSSTHGTLRVWNGNEWATAGALKARATETGKSASISSTSLQNLTGVFRVAIYLVVTTAGAAGSTVKAGVSWNDGTAGRGAETDTIVATATNFTQKDVVVRVNSAGLNYFTVVTNGGSPLEYALYVRVEPLD